MLEEAAKEKANSGEKIKVALNTSSAYNATVIA